MKIIENENQFALDIKYFETIKKLLSSSTGRLIYSPKLLAEHLGTSVKTIHNYKDQGLITYSQTNSSIFFRDEHVQQFLEENQVIVEKNS